MTGPVGRGKTSLFLQRGMCFWCLLVGLYLWELGKESSLGQERRSLNFGSDFLRMLLHIEKCAEVHVHNVQSASICAGIPRTFSYSLTSRDSWLMQQHLHFSGVPLCIRAGGLIKILLKPTIRASIWLKTAVLIIFVIPLLLFSL